MSSPSLVSARQKVDDEPRQSETWLNNRNVVLFGVGGKVFQGYARRNWNLI